MTEVKPKMEFTVNEAGEKLPVIIAAAGSSARMGTNKLLLEIGGMPVIARTMSAFEKSERISRIILVTRAEDVFTLQMLGKKYGITKISDIVCGGNSRAESVLKGFARLGDEKKVLIHDGARPFVTDEIINSVADRLCDCHAVTCAVKVKDTIKQVDENGAVVSTPDRNSLVAVQTPQGVSVSEYLAAAKSAEDISVFTDDMSVMESAGHAVYTVEGSYKNIKITTPEDVLSAEVFLGEDI